VYGKTCKHQNSSFPSRQEERKAIHIAELLICGKGRRHSLQAKEAEADLRVLVSCSIVDIFFPVVVVIYLGLFVFP
jgi:hypothetical protein